MGWKCQALKSLLNALLIEVIARQNKEPNLRLRKVTQLAFRYYQTLELTGLLLWVLTLVDPIDNMFWKAGCFWKAKLI